MNKKAGFTDLFILMIVAFVVILISGVFIYLGNITETQLKSTLQDKIAGANESEVIDDTFGNVNMAYSSLYWISMFLIIGMVISIFIGSYLVTTKPIFFVPYIFIIIIATVISVGISNAYEQLILTPELVSTYAGFTGSTFFMLNLPIWIVIIGFVGGIIMFSRLGSQEQERFI